MNRSSSTYSQTPSNPTCLDVFCCYTSSGNDPRKGWRIPLNEIKYNEQRDAETRLSYFVQHRSLCRFDSTGKEKDEETGYGYFGARYYDADLLTGWLSVDPMADKYPSMSPYNYCAGNPMKLVDPDGCEFGDYYNESGKYLGSDGIEDGKIYVVPFKTDQRKVENGNYNVEKYELPSLESRNLMCEYLEHSDQNDNLREYGGSIWEDELTGEQELRYAIPGTRWNGESHSASVIVNDNGNDSFDASGKRVLTFFHSHFSGTINGHGLRQYPSGIDDDINNGDVQNVMKNGSRFGDARLPYNIMVAMKTKEVFLYTSVGVKCKMNLDVFKGIGGTK